MIELLRSFFKLLRWGLGLGFVALLVFFAIMTFTPSKPEKRWQSHLTTEQEGRLATITAHKEKLSAGIGLIKDGIPQIHDSYVPPPAGTKSLIRDISAVRNSDGSITVSGVVLLPQKTKIWVMRFSSDQKENLGQATAIVGVGGAFSAGKFSDRGISPKAGPQHVHVVAYFNALWQTPDILRIVGDNGRNLPATALRPDDPEFPAAAGYLEDERVIEFPAPSEENTAIERVKTAKLYVQEKGQAVDTVGFIVSEFAKAPGFTPLGWSALKNEDKWTVTLECQDGATRKKAQWEFDPVSTKVSYLDPLSKGLSWMPAE